MKRARTRLQSRIKPIKNYQAGGEVFPPYEGLHNRPYKEEDELLRDDILNARGKMERDFRQPKIEGREKPAYWGNIDQQPRDRPNPVKSFARGGVSPELHEYHQWLNQGGRVNHYQQAGVAVPPPEVMNPDNRMLYRLNDESVGPPRSPLQIPIGRGELSVRPYVAPGQTAEVEGQYEYPMNNGSISAHGYVRQPMYEPNMRPDYGVGLRFKKNFQQGGQVQMADKGDIEKGRDIGDPLRPDADYESLGYLGDPDVNPRTHPVLDWNILSKGPRSKDLEYWRRRREVPTSAINTQYAQRGGAIKKYQTGGWTEDAQGNPIVQPTEPPQQPTPGASGQQVPAVPPPQTPTPPTAIGTSGFVDPLKDFKDDEHLEAEKRAEEEMASSGKIQSIRPGGDFLSGGPPPAPRDLTGHAEYDKLQNLKSMLPQVIKEDTSKTQRFVKEAQTTIDQLENRMRRETVRGYEAGHKEFLQKEKDEIRKADNARRAGLLQLPQLNGDIATAYGTEQVSIQKQIASAKTPEQRRAAAQVMRASPMTTLGEGAEGERQRAYLTRELLNTNHDMDARDAAAALMHLATPPIRGTEGFNKLKGKAAASYTLGPRDAVGNYMLNTEIGMIRVSPKVYGLIKHARDVGYSNMVADHKTYVEAKQREDKPGFVARNVDAAIDAVGGLFK